jgi:type IV pilus assembly protein PilO
VPRLVACLALMIAIVVGLWFVWLSSSDQELEQEQAKEATLKEDYSKKLAQAVNLDALKKQREQVQQYVTQLEKQLPSKAEMDALLSDINQAGLGRSLSFELFRPGQVSVKEYYAELPIALKVTGRYHDIGSFASDIANLSRIVTLNNVSSPPGARPAVDGSHRQDVPLPGRRRSRQAAQGRRPAKGAKK